MTQISNGTKEEFAARGADDPKNHSHCDRPTTIACWPSGGISEHPHHTFVTNGWHSFGCRGRWDGRSIRNDFAQTIQFSECQGQADAPEPLDCQWKMLTFSPEEGVIVIMSDPRGGMSMLVVWASSHEIARRHFLSLRDRYKRKPKRKAGASNFAVITVRDGSLDTRSIELHPALRDENDLLLHYGSEFVQWSSQFIVDLKRRESGIAVLRGAPGTGKTSFLRYLTRKLRRTHRFYYLPLSVFPLLANPSAVDFWLSEHEFCKKLKKVVILEDAESLLMQRASDNQERVSNLLNISDGFLGDVLKLHVICTINCPIDKIDSAITRPGRLLTIREFVRISAAQAKALAEAKHLSLSPQRDYSLAELYNSATEVKGRENVLGFDVIRRARRA